MFAASDSRRCLEAVGVVLRLLAGGWTLMEGQACTSSMTAILLPFHRLSTQGIA